MLKNNFIFLFEHNCLNFANGKNIIGESQIRKAWYRSLIHADRRELLLSNYCCVNH